MVQTSRLLICGSWFESRQGHYLFYGDPPPLASKTKAGDKPNASFVGCSSKLQSRPVLMKVPYKTVEEVSYELIRCQFRTGILCSRRKSRSCK